MEIVKEEKKSLKSGIDVLVYYNLSNDFFLDVDASLCGVTVPRVWTTASPDLVIPGWGRKETRGAGSGAQRWAQRSIQPGEASSSPAHGQGLHPVQCSHLGCTLDPRMGSCVQDPHRAGLSGSDFLPQLWAIVLSLVKFPGCQVEKLRSTGCRDLLGPAQSCLPLLGDLAVLSCA